VVTDASLDITPGEVVAVLGANGSGKTTLVRGIIGLANILRGSVELFGTPVSTFHERWRIGYVPQRQNATGGIPTTVTEFVSSGRLARRKPWQRANASDRQRVQDAIASVGLAARARDQTALLSGGQYRRVLIARALAADADALMLDEPTAGVDYETQEQLTETMAELVMQGVTIVLVTHELGPAVSIVTRVVQMRNGHIVYDGPPRPSDVHTHEIDHHDDDDAPPPAPFGLSG
jgi:zinc transport system ATP-binding protein